jgi:hypothetical protein
MADNEGLPADPYNLRAEWGPSSYGDLRHRAAGGVTVPLRWKFSVSVFLLANSGQPYNITTGLDPNSTGYAAARPALDPVTAPSACELPNLKYEIGVGCFNLNPGPGVPVIGRNFARGPSAVNFAPRVAHVDIRSGTQRRGSVGSGRGRPALRQKYNVVLSASTLNALNHPNFATQRRSLLAVLRPIPESRRSGGHVARWRAQHVQAKSTCNCASRSDRA